MKPILFFISAFLPLGTVAKTLVVISPQQEGRLFSRDEGQEVANKAFSPQDFERLFTDTLAGNENVTIENTRLAATSGAFPSEDEYKKKLADILKKAKTSGDHVVIVTPRFSEIQPAIGEGVPEKFLASSLSPDQAKASSLILEPGRKLFRWGWPGTNTPSNDITLSDYRQLFSESGANVTLLAEGSATGIAAEYFLDMPGVNVIAASESGDQSTICLEVENETFEDSEHFSENVLEYFGQGKTLLQSQKEAENDTYKKCTDHYDSKLGNSASTNSLIEFAKAKCANFKPTPQKTFKPAGQMKEVRSYLSKVVVTRLQRLHTLYGQSNCTQKIREEERLRGKVEPALTSGFAKLLRDKAKENIEFLGGDIPVQQYVATLSGSRLDQFNREKEKLKNTFQVDDARALEVFGYLKQDSQAILQGIPTDNCSSRACLEKMRSFFTQVDLGIFMELTYETAKVCHDTFKPKTKVSREPSSVKEVYDCHLRQKDTLRSRYHSIRSIAEAPNWKKLCAAHQEKIAQAKSFKKCIKSRLPWFSAEDGQIMQGYLRALNQSVERPQTSPASEKTPQQGTL